MNVDPRQNDPRYQSPLADDSQQATQFGMGSQADVPLRHDASGTVPGTSSIDPHSITPGADVYGTDGKRLGTVQEVYDDSFLVQKGIFFVHDYFVPLEVVTQAATDRIDVGLTSDEAKRRDWSRRPGLASVGRGVQADSATDTLRSGLPTQSNVNPSGLGARATGGETASTSAHQGAGVVMPNQAPNAPLGMPTGTGLNPSGTMPAEYDAGQYDRSMNADPRAVGSEVNPGRLVPADEQEAETQRSGGLTGGTSGTGEAGGDSPPTSGLTGDPYRASALPADSVGEMNTPTSRGHEQGPAYGSMPAENTPLQEQVPASSAEGRTSAADTMQRATERGMQGTRDASSDTLSGAPEEPRNLDDWDPSEQGVTNP